MANSISQIPANPVAFASARPVWPKGRELEKNLLVGFRAVFRAPAAAALRLRLAAATLYRVFVNGRFLAHGPARAAHEFYRVDEWNLTGHVGNGDNVLAIEVAGYNINSYCYLNQPSFLQAEILADGDVLAATGNPGADFVAFIVPDRVQRVQRYSFQRAFIEVYRKDEQSDAWRRRPDAPVTPGECAIQREKKLLPRGVPYPDFRTRPALWSVAEGQVRRRESVEKLWQDRALTHIGPTFAGYPLPQLELVLSNEIQFLENDLRPLDQPLTGNSAIQLQPNFFQLLDLGTNLTGFIGMSVTCVQAVRLLALFGEILVNGDVDFKRNSSVQVVCWDLQPGRYALESLEPYTLRYLKLMVLGGAAEIRSPYLREYVNPDSRRAVFSCSDRDLNLIFEAGRQTFAQNAVDIFMDCPGRERAGWLCDSYFTARVERDLTGTSRVERNFIKNFLLPEGFAHHPDGMLPMCYPADHDDGNFIPQWAMWFVLQLEEYLARTGDVKMVEALKPRVLKLLAFLARYRNEDGLLERLPRWNFVEWSKANEFVQDVNYPTNMLYAAVLGSVARLYQLHHLKDEASRIRNVVLTQSYDGEYFVDNAVRQNGRLQVTRNRTEICQYFAFYFSLANPETHPELWQTLVTSYGPRSKGAASTAALHPANAFIGYYLRMELLSRYGLYAQLLSEIRGYFLPMAQLTGTLWENKDMRASCNHGFASHVCHLLLRDILGIKQVDAPANRILLSPPDLPLSWCRASIPIGQESADLEWWRQGNELHYRLSAPLGFTLQVQTAPSLKAVRHP